MSILQSCSRLALPSILSFSITMSITACSGDQKTLSNEQDRSSIQANTVKSEHEVWLGDTSLVDPNEGDTCASLNESECGSTPGCIVEFSVTVSPDGSCAECSLERGECPPCEPAEATQSFVACRALGECEGLDEDTCRTKAACEAVIAPSVCQAIACVDGSDCPSIDCDPSPTYLGCYPKRDKCEGLAEDACSAAEACEPIIAPPPCVKIACVEGGECPDVECDATPSYLGCSSKKDDAVSGSEEGSEGSSGGEGSGNLEEHAAASSGSVAPGR